MRNWSIRVRQRRTINESQLTTKGVNETLIHLVGMNKEKKPQQIGLISLRR